MGNNYDIFPKWILYDLLSELMTTLLFYVILWRLNTSSIHYAHLNFINIHHVTQWQHRFNAFHLIGSFHCLKLQLHHKKDNTISLCQTKPHLYSSRRFLFINYCMFHSIFRQPPSKMLGRFIHSTPPPYSMLRYARRDFNHTILPIRNVH